MTPYLEETSDNSEIDNSEISQVEANVFPVNVIKGQETPTILASKAKAANGKTSQVPKNASKNSPTNVKTKNQKIQPKHQSKNDKCKITGHEKVKAESGDHENLLSEDISVSTLDETTLLPNSEKNTSSEVSEIPTVKEKYGVVQHRQELQNKKLSKAVNKPVINSAEPQQNKRSTGDRPSSQIMLINKNARINSISSTRPILLTHHQIQTFKMKFIKFHCDLFKNLNASHIERPIDEEIEKLFSLILVETLILNSNKAFIRDTVEAFIMSHSWWVGKIFSYDRRKYD